PQFGHYQRYDGRLSQTDPNAANPHPFKIGTSNYFTMSSGEILSANNMTYDSNGGPPMGNDFYADPGTSPTTTINSNTLVSAFSSPSTVLPTDTTYNTQNIAYASTAAGPVGDRYPRKGGSLPTPSTTWDPSTTRGAARNAAELLYASGSYPATPA